MAEQPENTKVEEANERVGAEAHDKDRKRERMHETHKKRWAERKD